MKTVGIAATIVLAAGIVIATLAGARSIPDVKRYLKIRAM